MYYITVVFLKLKIHIYNIISKFFSDAAFKKQILRLLQLIHLKQSQIWQDVQVILTKITMENDYRMLTNNEDTIFDKFVFPLKSIDELNAVEEHLMDETNSNMFVSIK